jgi:hypothetical protein
MLVNLNFEVFSTESPGPAKNKKSFKKWTQCLLVGSESTFKFHLLICKNPSVHSFSKDNKSSFCDQLGAIEIK